MKYYSLNKKAPSVSFKNAVINGLAPDKGLYFPETITPLSKEFINNLTEFTNEQIGYEVIKQFIGDDIRLVSVPVENMRDIPEMLNFYMGKNTPDRRRHIEANLV